MADVRQAAERADSYVMALCTPEQMTKQEALDFLEALMARLKGAVEALHEEVENEKQ